MRGVNKVTLLGNVGADPEIRSTASGTRIAKVSLATSRKYKDVEETEWHRLTIFGRLADIVEQYVAKGDKLFVEGRLHYSQTEGEGGTRYWTEVIVNELVMLGGAADRLPAPAPREPVASAPLSQPDDDLPF